MALSPEARERAEEIFFDLMDGETAPRDAELLALCDGEEDIASEVRALLKANQAASTIIPAPAASEVPSMGDIGPYRIVGELGRGGMGTVHLAERVGDYEMEVAIKVLPPALAGTKARERFVAERRILARLQHPGIARLLDGGWTEDGRPYIVMERVDGMSIRDYVGDRSVNERLELFLQVADAVQYAHRHLVVHRDLKPTNILVSREGRVKLLDFGIAKLLDDDDSTESLTRTGERLLTPDYASPEQIRGEAVTTASDVYQLGVVLYEMLSGTLPFHLKGRSLVEVERTVSDTIPKPPSIRVTESVNEEDRRRTARALKGDLDNIIMKALRKEPEQRYASPEAMANDVRRHLAGLPVEARGTTAWYVLRKFVRRHKAAVTAASLLLVSLLAFALISVRQAQQIAQERDRVTQERDIARQVQSFMEELFEQAAPENADSQDVTVRDVLNVGALRIQTDLEQTPVARAAFMNVIGSAYGVVGDRESGRALLEQALEIRIDIDPDGLDAAESMNDLGVVELRARNHVKADSLLSRALQLRIANNALSTEVATTRMNLASVRTFQRRFDEAEALYEEALPVFERRFGPGHRHWAVAMNNYALLKRSMDRRTEAESLLVDLIPAVRSIARTTPVPLATTLANLGTVYHEQGKYAEAVLAFAESVEILSRLENTRPTESIVRQNLAASLGFLDRPTEAEQEFQKALDIRLAMYGRDDFRLAGLLNNWGAMSQRLERLEDAEAQFREAVRLVRQTDRMAWRDRAQMELNWAWTLMLMERHQEATTIYQGILSAAREGLDVPDKIRFDTRWGLARSLAALQEWTAAEQEFQLAIQMADSLFGSADRRPWRVRVGMGELLAETGREQEAAGLLRVAADSLTALEELDDPFLTTARSRLARLSGSTAP
ncbi:MAG: serine/threonine protein kinase [Rhodothermales bacterium]|nr:serine/threonine protein kinase [Rhodothermales bacterium]MBO6778578.1 serine/threonine protein kinase [Rhodothermales bacterium]